MKVYFLVLARDAKLVSSKVSELSRLGCPYLIVCGERTDLPNTVYREPRGKYDAINFGLSLLPSDVDVIVFNDVDTEIHNFGDALSAITTQNVDLVFARVQVVEGPQTTFYSFLDTLRKRIPLAASGELMLVRFDVLKKILPIQGCKAEDSYILYKILEKNGRVAFCQKCYVTTKRTTRSEQEESYKRRTVAGIYQALSMSRPPLVIRSFYIALPFLSPLLLVLGKRGYYWSKGILLGYFDYLRGDTSSSWRPTY